MEKNELFGMIQTSLEFAVGVEFHQLDESIEKFDRTELRWSECPILPSGQFILGVTSELSVTIAAHMFDTAKESLSQIDIMDALNELTNIMTGKVKEHLIIDAEIGIPNRINPLIMNSLNNQSCQYQVMVQIGEETLFVGLLGNVFRDRQQAVSE